MADPTITTDHIIMFQDWYTGDYITLGSGNFCSAKLEGLGSPDYRSNEMEMPGGDGYIFGREYLGLRKWTITGAIKSGINSDVPSDDEQAWNLMSQLLRAWDYSPARQSPRDVVPLYWKRPGREAVLIYGRPDRIDPDVTGAYHGLIKYSAIFRQSDPKFYSTVENAESIPLNEPYAGGFQYNTAMTALIQPLTLSPYVQFNQSIVVGGDVPTNPVIVIHGPVANPSVQFLGTGNGDDWLFKLYASVPSGKYVTVDTRLWERSITRNDGVNLAGAYEGPRMSLLTLPPATCDLIYTGADVSETSNCQIKYRNAWAAV